ncbi:type Z 30S ribosomal protein S14 [Candidatus Vampirococcus lugosii]|uniref:Small ribosomal subunit protein uS14 n=1 Tax=Candidatus Vampirococcus lugosii TaxID=2789015 RepID=A0ABS5QL70_9BACT|nr:Ribosomal protein S14 [Candidatus Vampirococcus lugosii]
MARKSLRVKHEKLDKKRLQSLASGNKLDNPTKYYNRCRVCGRTRSYMREFGICRVCFRKYAREGLIVGVRKSSR